MDKITLRFVPGDVVVFMLARNKRAMLAMAKRDDSWGKAARRILKRLDKWGLGVAQVAKALKQQETRRGVAQVAKALKQQETRRDE